MTDKQTIAVLGAGGTMGFPIARNLAQAGFPVRAWNRSREKAEPLESDGVVVTGSPAEALDGADVILTILSDADTVLSCVEAGLAEQHAGDRIWLQMSTIGEDGIERCAELARQHELTLVDAPVLGTKAPAEQGKLVILASGPESVRDRLAPIFEAVGQRTMWVGETGTGSKLKVATNSWIISVVEGAAETLALAEGLGLEPQLVLDAVKGGPLDLPYLQMKGKAIIERDFDPSFQLKLAAKDAGLVVDSATRHDLDLPLLTTIRERLEEGAETHGDEDMAATYLTSSPNG